MAEKDFSSSSAPLSPDESTAAGVRPGYFAEPIPQRLNPSTALFPDFEPLLEDVSYEGATASCQDQNFGSQSEQPLTGSRTAFQTLPALDMHAAHPDMSGFSPESISSPNFATNHANGYSSFVSSGAALQQFKDNISPSNHGLPSPEEDDTVSEAALRSQYQSLQTRSYSTSMVSPAHGELTTPHVFGDNVRDSFKSPPPPANLAVRRKIPRPAALHSASLKSRTMGSGPTPKMVLDGPRRLDPSSPATAMRRIVSATGNMPGRIQKSTVTPRSPMFFGRNSETLLQYHTRSPASSAGPLTSPFSAAPDTPMTPAVMGQHTTTEPALSTSIDDEALYMDSNTPIGLLGDFRLNMKTPPGTPGLLMNSATHFSLPNYASNPDLSDRPLLTPYFQSTFPEFQTRIIPSYVDGTGSSVPTTPLYPTIPTGEQRLAVQAIGATHYDWDANESVTSSSQSSPDVSQANVHFISNMAQQHYNINDQ